MPDQPPAGSLDTFAHVDVRYVDRGVWVPVIVVQVPPPTVDRWPVLDPVLRHLRDAGWARPELVWRGPQINSGARAIITVGTADGLVAISGGGMRIFRGLLPRSPGWVVAAQAAGTVVVVVTTLDDDSSPLARDGEVLAAPGVLVTRDASTPDGASPEAP